MDRIVIITGAKGGIGQAIVRKFQRETGLLFTLFVLVDRPGLKIDSYLFNSRFFPLDVTDWDSCVFSFKNIFSLYKDKCIVLINAAGILPEALPFVKMGSYIAKKTMDVNFWGVWNCCKAVLPTMRKHGYGRIVNISSVSASAIDPGNTPYAVSKAAVEKLTKQLASEAPFNKNGLPFDITVNAVSPAMTETSMIEKVPKKSCDNAILKTPIQRLIRPEEVAEAVYFLATASNAFNGIILPVDGGYS